MHFRFLSTLFNGGNILRVLKVCLPFGLSAFFYELMGILYCQCCVYTTKSTVAISQWQPVSLFLSKASFLCQFRQGWLEDDGVHQKEIMVIYSLASKIFATQLLFFKQAVPVFFPWEYPFGLFFIHFIQAQWIRFIIRVNERTMRINDLNCLF